MPIATPEVYADMLDRAKAGSFAYPAINITSSQTVTAAIRGFAEAGSDGIIQVSTGGAEYASGSTIKDMVTGSLALAAYAREVAKNYSVNIALHTDHCPKNKLDGFVRPLIAASAEQVKSTGLPIFQSHMWDGSAVPLDENLQIAEELLALAKAAQHHPRGRDRRRRWRGGRCRQRDQRAALHDPRRRPEDRGGARPRRERPLHGRAHLRQRARRLQAGQRQAAPRDPQAVPGRHRRRPRRRPPATSRSTWSSTAARARCPRRSRRPSTTASSR